jgi:hypothetical protein
MLEYILELFALWAGSIVLLLISNFVFRRVDVPRSWRLMTMAVLWIGVAVLVILPLILSRSLASLVVAIPVAFVVFAVGQLGLVYHWKLFGGASGLRDQLLEDHPDVQAQFERNRYLSWVKRTSDRLNDRG